MESQVEEKPLKIREYARTLGISDTSVHKAINAGYITESSWVLDAKGRKLIIASRANAEWKENYNPTRSQLTKAGKSFTFDVEQPSAPPVSEPPAQPAAPPQQRSAPPPIEEIGGAVGDMSVAKLKQISEKLKIAKAQIELKELQGTLVPKKEVYDAFFTFGQEMRQTLMAIPDRIIDEILATPERALAHNILTDAIVKALASLSEMGSRDISKRK
jgi:hypothetical protein